MNANDAQPLRMTRPGCRRTRTASRDLASCNGVTTTGGVARRHRYPPAEQLERPIVIRSPDLSLMFAAILVAGITTPRVPSCDLAPDAVLALPGGGAHFSSAAAVASSPASAEENREVGQDFFRGPQAGSCELFTTDSPCHARRDLGGGSETASILIHESKASTSTRLLVAKDLRSLFCSCGSVTAPRLSPTSAGAALRSKTLPRLSRLDFALDRRSSPVITVAVSGLLSLVGAPGGAPSALPMDGDRVPAWDPQPKENV